jgi:protein-disulfide isomerase
VDPGKYFAFHTAMMQARGGLSEKHILRFAEAAGLDAERIRREMESPDIKEMLDRNNRLAQRLGIRGTPGFVIGGQVVPGAIDLETMRQMIDEARKS